MKVIHKHIICDLNDADHKLVVPVSMKYDASVIKVGIQANAICIWEFHDTDSVGTEIIRNFITLGTGYPYEEAVHIYDTVFDFPYVWHVGEILDLTGTKNWVARLSLDKSTSVN
jgi:hypothetical protein